MRKKTIRRVLTMIFVVLLLVAFSCSASAMELFRDQYEYKWNNSTSGHVYVSWINGNVPSSSAGVTAANLTTGNNYWKFGTEDYAAVYHPTNDTVQTMPNTGWVIHSIASVEYWNSYVETGFTTSTLAVAIPYSTSGVAISEGIGGSHPACGQSIAYAYIYYSPYNTSYSGTNWNNVVAHEIGHTLGFGHVVSGDDVLHSIMKEETTNYNGIQAYDRIEFVSKYQ